MITTCGPNLKEIYLRGCKKITDISIQKIAELCPKLEVLDISTGSRFGDFDKIYIKDVTDKSLIQICKNCKNLKVLDLEGCKITSKTAQAIISNCFFLEKLNLRFVAPQVVETISEALHSSGCLPHLRVLETNYSSGFLRMYESRPILRYRDIE